MEEGAALSLPRISFSGMGLIGVFVGLIAAHLSAFDALPRLFPNMTPFHHLVKVGYRRACASGDGMGAPAATWLVRVSNSKPQPMLVTKV